MSTPARHFCAVDSAAVGDPLAGTALHPQRNLLISWPRAKWVRNLRKARDMPPDVEEMLDELADAGRRVNLIHRRGQASHRHHIILLPECRTYTVEREALPRFLATLLRNGPLDAWQTGVLSGSLMLCCTHGRKDKCCARFGYQAYKAITEAANRHNLPFDVWESTHLGGCRLAAGAMLFPQRRKYGRIGEEDALPLLRAEAEGRPYLPCYRGSSDLTPPEQCAEVAALKWLETREPQARVSVRGRSATPRGHERHLPVRWHNGSHGGVLTVTCRETPLIRHDTCADYEAGGKGAHPVGVWFATAVRPGSEEQAVSPG